MIVFIETDSNSNVKITRKALEELISKVKEDSFSKGYDQGYDDGKNSKLYEEFLSNDSLDTEDIFKDTKDSDRKCTLWTLEGDTSM